MEDLYYYAIVGICFVIMYAAVVLTASEPNHTITIDVIDDTVYEPQDYFTIDLSLLESSASQRFTLNPSNVTVVILDNDGMFSIIPD